MPTKKQLTSEQTIEIIALLEKRFEANTKRHPNLRWEQVKTKLEQNKDKLWSLYQMEQTGGEPDVMGHDAKSGEIIFVDCAIESPKGRRSLCYDQAALKSRKTYKPVNSAVNLAKEMGVELLSEDQYFDLQQLGAFDNKTSSWLKTPKAVREKGGAIFGDYRFGRVFIYHNGAESYYGARGFRAFLRI